MDASHNNPIRVAELFAGVGGFRLGLEGDDYEFVFSNQWEPNEIAQWASKIYVQRFGDKGHTNRDLHELCREVPEHDMLVGGFPCQDYSVARTISGELGIEGEKGKLWTPIREIIEHSKVRPKLIFLENVPRLLNSPSKFRGLNFAWILKDLLDLGYDVEWRVIQASDYGFPQKRKRVFIAAYRRATNTTFYRNGPGTHGPNTRTRGPMVKWLTGATIQGGNKDWKTGPFAKAFPAEGVLGKKKNPLPTVENYTWSKKSSPFKNTGYAWRNNQGESWFWSFKSTPIFEGEQITLKNILSDKVDDSYTISDEEKLRKYKYIKGEQKEWRIRKKDRIDAEGIDTGSGNLWDMYQECTKSYNKEVWSLSRDHDAFRKGVELGIIYDYSAGSMAFPDSLSKPSRTVVTAEIGKSVSRMRHVIENPPNSGNYRGLMPIELERLNMFPDNWTEYTGISDSRRGFLMGNALVVGIVEKLATPFAELIRDGSE
jgi:DNA (cytosine-5)-methyltransferase 1